MKKNNKIIILAIETSCDDTCIALLEAKDQLKPKFKILSNIVSSQVEVHKKWGGVYPTLAKREHQKNLPKVFKKAMEKAKNPKIDLIAVTVGPGLEPCLWIGVNFAKDLAQEINLPIVAINHIEAHIFANFIKKIQDTKCPLFTHSKIRVLFPAVCLVVSGGHTQLILMKNYRAKGDISSKAHYRNYKILGETRDDAAGECLDKVARILGLSYPGGPVIETEARCRIKDKKYRIQLPRPMISQKNYDFSFSGLKTAVLYHFKNQSEKDRKSKKYTRAMCKEVQQAGIDVLIRKTIKAAKDYKAKTIILGGGVAANRELRKQLQEKTKKELPNTKYLTPDTYYCTDNAAMVGVAAYFSWLKGNIKSWKKIKADANLKI